MDVITFNVGQGSMVMVRHAGEAIIVDARIPPSNDTVAYVKKILSTFSKHHFVRGLILTGFDRDHADVSGVALVLRKYRPEWILYPDYDSDTESFAAVHEIIAEEQHARRESTQPLESLGITMESLNNGRLSSLSNVFDLRFFSPHPDDMDSSNNSSIVVKISGRGGDGFSYLVTGDTENPRWERINAIFRNQLLSDVMAAPHHGSKNGTNAETLLLVSPNTILISAGVDNPFGHPHPGVLSACTSVAKHVFATNTDRGNSLHTKRQGADFRTIAFQD